MTRPRAARRDATTFYLISPARGRVRGTPVDPNFLERLLPYRLDRAPAPALDLFGAAAFEAVGFALDAGVFETLADGPATPAELGARLDFHEDGLRALLGLLEATGHVAVEGDGGAYRNTSSTERCLTPAPDTDVGPC